MSEHLRARKPRKMITRDIVLGFLDLLQQDKRISDIAIALDISASTVNRLTKRYNEGGLDDPALFETAPEKHHKHSSHHQEEVVIRREIAERCTITQRELSECLSKERLAASQPTVCRILKSAGYSWKKLVRVPSSRNLDANIAARKEYADMISEIPDEMLVFLDETGFNLHTCPSRGYSLIGTEARQIVPANRGRNVSLMCAISVHGVLAFELIVGPYDSAKFCNFIKERLVPAMTTNNLQGACVVMDNCRIHKTDAVQRLLAEHEITGVFLPHTALSLTNRRNFGYCTDFGR